MTQRSRSATPEPPPLDGALAAAGHPLRALQQCTTVSALLAKAADLVRMTGRFDRAVTLTVDGDALSSRPCGPLEHDPSDRLRRALLRRPIAIGPQTIEGRWLRLGVDAGAAKQTIASALAGEDLGLGHVAVGPIAPDGALLAVVVGCSDTAITSIEQATAEGTAELAGVALSRLVMTARLREAVEALRSLAVSTEALIEEIVRAPVQIPFEGAGGLTFPQLRREAQDVNRARAVLTDREIEVASLLVNGRSDRDIAETLVISVNTAKDHVARIRRKLQAANRVEAAAKFLRLTQEA